MPRSIPQDIEIAQAAKLRPITEIADALNYTHTAIKNFANEMIQRDLIQATQDRSDKRRRILRLTRKGRQVVDQLVPVWRHIRLSR